MDEKPQPIENGTSTMINDGVTAPGNAALVCLREALSIQRAYLGQYERPCEPIAYETLRAIDDLFCRELMEPALPSKNDRLFRR